MITSRITAAQCRGARAMLAWSRRQLAARARVAERTIIDFERGARAPHASTLTVLRAALEAGGVEFTYGARPGVRMEMR